MAETGSIPLLPQPGRGALPAWRSLLRQTYGETHTADLLNVCVCAYAHAYGIGATEGVSVASPPCPPARDHAPGWHGEVAPPWTGQLLHCRGCLRPPARGRPPGNQGTPCAHRQRSSPRCRFCSGVGPFWQTALPPTPNNQRALVAGTGARTHLTQLTLAPAAADSGYRALLD